MIQISEADYQELLSRVAQLNGELSSAWEELKRRPMVGVSVENNYAQDGTLAMNISHLCEDLRDMHERLQAAINERNGFCIQAERAESERVRCCAELRRLTHDHKSEVRS